MINPISWGRNCLASSQLPPLARVETNHILPPAKHTTTTLEIVVRELGGAKPGHAMVWPVIVTKATQEKPLECFTQPNEWNPRESWPHGARFHPSKKRGSFEGGRGRGVGGQFRPHPFTRAPPAKGMSSGAGKVSFQDKPNFIQPKVTNHTIDKVAFPIAYQRGPWNGGRGQSQPHKPPFGGVRSKASGSAAERINPGRVNSVMFDD